MNKAVAISFLAFVILILAAAFVFKKTPSQPDPTSTPAQVTIFEKYSNGSCSTNSDCAPAGCSSHICSSDPGLITTCEAISDHPKDDGYSCGCINTTCVWYK